MATFSPDPTPFSLDDWPKALGFELLLTGPWLWVKGDYTLQRIDKKTWTLSHRAWERPKRLVTLCRFPGSIAEDLTTKAREVMEAA